MNPQDQAAFMRRFLDRIWGEEAVDEIPDFIAERYDILNDPGDPWHEQTLDREGYRNRLVTSRSAFPDQRFQPVDILTAPDRIAVSWHWTGTHAGDLPGFPASGRPIRMTGITVYGFDGRHLTSHWQSVDRLGVFMQLQGHSS